MMNSPALVLSKIVNRPHSHNLDVLRRQRLTWREPNDSDRSACAATIGVVGGDTCGLIVDDVLIARDRRYCLHESGGREVAWRQG